MFRGREVTHPERGTAILDRLAEELSELGVVEQRPMQEGRNMTMMMAPSKAVLAGRVEVPDATATPPEAAVASHERGDVAGAAIAADGEPPTAPGKAESDRESRREQRELSETSPAAGA
jgi:translation initiation factor IF-3